MCGCFDASSLPYSFPLSLGLRLPSRPRLGLGLRDPLFPPPFAGERAAAGDALLLLVEAAVVVVVSLSLAGAGDGERLSRRLSFLGEADRDLRRGLRLRGLRLRS